MRWAWQVGEETEGKGVENSGKVNVSWVTWSLDDTFNGLEAKQKKEKNSEEDKKKLKSTDLIFRFLLSFQDGTKQR